MSFVLDAIFEREKNRWCPVRYDRILCVKQPSGASSHTTTHILLYYLLVLLQVMQLLHVAFLAVSCSHNKYNSMVGRE